MKILNTEQLQQADAYTITHEPITSEQLMERAGKKLFEKLVEIFPATEEYHIFCGKGNNGGDGAVIARYLWKAGKKVNVYVLASDSRSPEMSLNMERLKEVGIEWQVIENEDDLLPIQAGPGSIVIDALFGNGLKGPLSGFVTRVITHLHSLNAFVVAIDLPSGLSADGHHESTPQNTVCAQLTLTIQYPKLAFMFAENETFTGKVIMVDIGLHRDFEKQTETACYYVDEEMITSYIQPRSTFGHKGSFGHVLIGAGSEGKTGAAILTGTAALKTGCGLVSMHVPYHSMMAIHAHTPELMVIPDENPRYITQKIKDITRYDAIGFGPGAGTEKETADVLKNLINQYSKSLVIDADGINILAENKTWLSFLNGSTILTPHPGEFDRLTQKHQRGQDRFESQKLFSKKYGVYVVLKGQHTSVTTPGGLAFFNSTGNNGMATAGSGDVLTGIITSLCAQGYSPLHACLLGVYLHGYAGDKAAEENSVHSMIAGDIIHHIQDFFK